jgi:hypothetical protein
MRPAGIKQFGDFTVQRHQEADPITGAAKVTGSRISGPTGTFKVPHWPNRITGVTESNGQVFVDVKDGSRPYLTADDDRLTESQVSLAERLDGPRSEQVFTETEIGQLRFLVHAFEGRSQDVAHRLVEAGLNQSTADRLAAWTQQQSESLGKWQGPDSAMRESDPVIIDRSLTRAPLRLMRDAPQLPDGFLETYTASALADESAYAFPSGLKIEFVRGDDPFAKLYEHDARVNAELLADTEAALREAVRRQDDCSSLVARWLALHGDNRALRESDAHLVHIVAERVATGHGPARGRSQLDERVIAAQLLGAGQLREALKVESEGKVVVGASTRPGAGRAAGRVHALFNEGTALTTQVSESRARFQTGDLAACGHKIREGRRTCPHCGAPYDRMAESVWTRPEDIVRSFAQKGPWSATVERARKDLGYAMIEDHGGFRLEREGLPVIKVAVGADEQITEARLIEAPLPDESQHAVAPPSDAAAGGIMNGARKATVEPPHLRRGAVGKRCGFCEHFQGGNCTRYNYGVSAGELCDSFAVKMTESASRAGWKAESAEHEASVAHHNAKFMHHEGERKRHHDRALALGDQGFHADAREAHDRAAHHRRAAEHHSRAASASRELREDYGDTPNLPESPIDAGEADAPFTSMMRPTGAEEYGEFMEEGRRRAHSEIQSEADLAEARAGRGERLGHLRRSRARPGGRGFEAWEHVHIPGPRAPLVEKVKAARALGATMDSGGDLDYMPRVPFTKGETHKMVKEVAMHHKAAEAKGFGPGTSGHWNKLMSTMSVLEHAPDEHFESLPLEDGARLAEAAEMENYHTFSRRIPQKHWDELDYIRDRRDADEGDGEGSRRGNSAVARRMRRRRAARGGRSAVERTRDGFGEADFLEAKRHERCPQCDMKLQDPMAAKCPRCGESLQLSDASKKVDRMMAAGDSRSTSPRIKHNPMYDVGKFAESIVDDVLGEDDAENASQEGMTPITRTRGPFPHSTHRDVVATDEPRRPSGRRPLIGQTRRNRHGFVAYHYEGDARFKNLGTFPTHGRASEAVRLRHKAWRTERLGEGDLTEGKRRHMRSHDRPGAFNERKPRRRAKMHTFDSSSEAYDRTQYDDSIQNGDILHVPSEGVVGYLHDAWPVAVTEEKGSFHHHENPVKNAKGRHGRSFMLARQVAARHHHKLHDHGISEGSLQEALAEAREALR